jgi:adenylate kinase family enzyme
MILETLALKSIPWKWVIIAVVALLLSAAAIAVVMSYNRAIAQAELTKRELAATKEKLQAEQAKVAQMETTVKDLTAYYESRDERQQKAATRRSQILTRKEKKNGDTLAADDDTLLDLNRLFPGRPN